MPASSWNGLPASGSIQGSFGTHSLRRTKANPLGIEARVGTPQDFAAALLEQVATGKLSSTRPEQARLILFPSLLVTSLLTEGPLRDLSTPRQRSCRQERCVGKHPAEVQSQLPDLLQSQPQPRPQLATPGTPS